MLIFMLDLELDKLVIVCIICYHILQSPSLLENTTIISIDLTFKQIFKVKYLRQTHLASLHVTIDFDLTGCQDVASNFALPNCLGSAIKGGFENMYLKSRSLLRTSSSKIIIWISNLVDLRFILEKIFLSVLCNQTVLCL